MSKRSLSGLMQVGNTSIFALDKRKSNACESLFCSAILKPLLGAGFMVWAPGTRSPAPANGPQLPTVSLQGPAQPDIDGCSADQVEGYTVSISLLKIKP